MSLSDLLRDVRKPWCSPRVEDLNIDGTTKYREGKVGLTGVATTLYSPNLQKTEQFVFTCTRSGASTNTKDLVFTRNGNTVTIEFPFMLFTTAVGPPATGPIISTTPVDEKYEPLDLVTAVHVPIAVQVTDNPSQTVQMGMFTFASDGTIRIFQDLVDSNFNAAAGEEFGIPWKTTVTYTGKDLTPPP